MRISPRPRRGLQCPKSAEQEGSGRRKDGSDPASPIIAALGAIWLIVSRDLPDRSLLHGGKGILELNSRECCFSTVSPALAGRAEGNCTRVCLFHPQLRPSVFRVWNKGLSESIMQQDLLHCAKGRSNGDLPAHLPDGSEEISKISSPPICALDSLNYDAIAFPKKVAAGDESLGDKADLLSKIAINLNYPLRDNVLGMSHLYLGFWRVACHQLGKQSDRDLRSHLESSSLSHWQA
jgi:hypothetical protein